MAKGKHAAASANRRLEAAQDHIDRQTDQLTEAKLRAREAERTAGQVEPLKRRVKQLEDDPASAELLEAMDIWKDAWKKAARQIKALQGAFIEQAQVLAGQKGMTGTEYLELMWRRHLDMWTDEDSTTRVRTGISGNHVAKHGRLSDEAVLRLQKVQGWRHSSLDVVSLWEQLLEAQDAGFTVSETVELLDEGKEKDAAQRALKRWKEPA